MTSNSSNRPHIFNTARQEKIYHDANAYEVLPDLLDTYEFDRATIICSKTINTKTKIIRKLEAALGPKCVGVIDEIGEHAPLQNVLAAAKKTRDSNSDVIIAVGGGSVMDLSKVVQLCISEDVYEKEALLRLQFEMKPNILDIHPASYAPARIRQIYIPTTMATAEWTHASTPKDEETGLKARFLVFDGGPLAIVYDPDITAQTPPALLLSTAIRGLDHAINSRCSTEPHPVSSALAEHAVKLFVENLPLLKKDITNRSAMSNCQLATTYSGMGVMSVIHSFSHWVVHVVGPYADVSHSDAACVFMLAQAKWLEGYADEQHLALKNLMGRQNEPMYQILSELLTTLEMPKSLQDLGIERRQIHELSRHTLEHPWTTKHNLRPVKTIDDVRVIMEIAWEQ